MDPSIIPDTPSAFYNDENAHEKPEPTPTNPTPRTRTPLAGLHTSGSAILANSARRRLNGPTLLGSPARRGHSRRMQDIFSSARNEVVDNKWTAVLPLRPKKTFEKNAVAKRHARSREDVENVDPQELRQEDPDKDDLVEYPNLPKSSVSTPSPVKNTVVSTRRNARPRDGIMSKTPSPISRATLRPVQPSRLSPDPSTKSPSFFDKPPRIAQAQIVAMHDIETIHTQDELLSSSSASWTGDSEFYRPLRAPPPRSRGDERKSSVPDWLEQLPSKPDEFQPETPPGDDEEELVPLSPDVEVEGGSMRRKLRKAGRLRSASQSSGCSRRDGDAMDED